MLAGLCFIPLTLWAIPSADLWWLLAEGRWITVFHSLPTHDPFAYTTGDQVWHNDQWLSSLLAYAVFMAQGVRGLQIAKIALLCLTFALAVRSARRGAVPVRWLSAVLAGLWCCSMASGAFFFDVRSYLWTYLFLVVWWSWLESPAVPLWWFGLSATLWANLHAGISGGLLILGLTWVGRAVERRDNRRDAARLCLALAASLVNPSGPQLLLHAVRLLGSDWGRYLNEWQPLWRSPQLYWHVSSQPRCFYLLFWALTVGLILWGQRDWRGSPSGASRPTGLPARAFPLLGIALLSLTGWRHIPLLCWLSIGLWANWLDRLLPPCPRPALAALVVAWLSWASWLLGHTDLEALSLENRFFPRWACEFLEVNRLGGRLFHPYGVGGYLLFRLWPDYQVAIDGRAAQVYPVEAYRDYLRAADNPSGFESFATRHGVQAVVTFADPRAHEVGSQLLEGNPDWKLAYQDEAFNVYVPVSLDQTRLRRPDNPFNLCQRALLASSDSAMALVDRALALDPHDASALMMKGSLLLRAGQPEGVGWIERALGERSDLTNAHFNLAVFYLARDRARARREARAELEVNPGFEPAHRMLVELGSG